MIYLFLIIMLPLTLIAEIAPRKVIAFWDSLSDVEPESSMVHYCFEMPLNYLGLDVEYYDIQQRLPRLSIDDGVCGILISLRVNARMADPVAFLEWAVDAIDKGKKVVLIGYPGFLINTKNIYTSQDAQNRLYEKLGFVNTQQWIDYPLDYQFIEKDTELLNFELAYPERLPGFYVTKIIDKSVKSLLKIAIPGQLQTAADLIILGQHGAYVSEYYAFDWDEILFATSPRSLGWYINPFLLFEKVFGEAHHPIADVTTLAGKRIFFSTMHGDGWMFENVHEEVIKNPVYTAEVILEKVILPNPDLPVSVGIIAAELDPTWVGNTKSQGIARRYLALPQVEAASHTYSHPFDWSFFRTGGKEKEINYLYLYPQGTWQNSFTSWFRAKSYQMFKPEEFAKKSRLKWGFIIPRSYANKPFNLDLEIFGAVEYINKFAPDNNKIHLLIWSGDSLPWGAPLLLCAQANLKTIGGGFVRFDEEYPSILFVYPIGRKVAGVVQPYAAAGAENNYTEGWTNNFYRFKYLPATLTNTDVPRRLKPIDLYYHSYSGQFKSSLDALVQNVAFIRTQNIIPIFASRYCGICDGFYSVEFEKLDSNKWKILNRKGLQTIRFDHASQLRVDFSSSKGVIGYTQHEGSIYVYLDKEDEAPVVAVLENGSRNEDKAPYLIDSNWEVWGVKREEKNINFQSQGWGKLSMRWQMPGSGTFQLKIGTNPVKTLQTSSNGVLTIDEELPYNVQTKISIE